MGVSYLVEDMEVQMSSPEKARVNYNRVLLIPLSRVMMEALIKRNQHTERLRFQEAIANACGKYF